MAEFVKKRYFIVPQGARKKYHILEVAGLNTLCGLRSLIEDYLIEIQEPWEYSDKRICKICKEEFLLQKEGEK